MHYRIAIGSDHRGYEIKQFLIAQGHIGADTVEWIDVGAFSAERTDYPLFAKKVVECLKNGSAELGVLLCGSGIGIAIAANRTPGIFAGVVWNPLVARMAKEDDNVNVLVLPADFVSSAGALESIQAWLNASFKEGRYRERVTMIEDTF